MTTIIFPGQGSQYLNMAIDFNDNFKIASDIFEQIEDNTKINIRQIISENLNDELNQTKFTQIAIFSTSMVIYKTIIHEFGIKTINPKIFLGHSLGEYSALVAKDILNISEASNLIRIRSELMDTAIEPNISGMAAIIGKNAEYIDAIIKKNNLNIQIANDNSPMQVVVSGLIKDIDAAQSIFISNGSKRYIKLNVSAAFHSKYMLEAQKELNLEIDNIQFSSNNTEIISNYDASINSDTKKIILSLKNQMANRVKWTDSIKKLEETNTTKIIEIGPGKVLSGLISRITNKFDIKSIDKIEDLNKFN